MASTGINADLTTFARMRTGAMDWQASPSPSVWRKRLEHFGDTDESGRVTSVVRYDSNSAFAPHGHPDGEEILVLDGVFSDEHGDYPAGTYLLNPTGFTHAPRSAEGCILFVKLCQYAGSDRPQLTVDTGRAGWQPTPFDGIEILPLYRSDTYPEAVQLIRARAGAPSPHHDHPGGEEIFVLDGAIEDDFGRHEKGDWIRYPDGSSHRIRTDTGALLYVKSGHLPAATHRHG